MWQRLICRHEVCFICHHVRPFVQASTSRYLFHSSTAHTSTSLISGSFISCGFLSISASTLSYLVRLKRHHRLPFPAGTSHWGLPYAQHLRRRSIDACIVQPPSPTSLQHSVSFLPCNTATYESHQKQLLHFRSSAQRLRSRSCVLSDMIPSFTSDMTLRDTHIHILAFTRLHTHTHNRAFIRKLV